MRFSQTVVYTKEREWEQYLVPATMEEALKLLKRFKGDARVIAGGTDLVTQARQGGVQAKVLVDVTRLSGLTNIKLDKGVIRIGAAVTHSKIAESALIMNRAQALAEGASRVGSPQIRNIGTIGGNIVNGQPGADTAIPLLALGAAVKVVGARGERTIPLNEFFVGIGQTRVDSTKEIATEISFPALKKGEASCALRLAKRKTLALPVLTVAVMISMKSGKTRTFKDVRIAVGPVAVTPLRCTQAEKVLAGNAITEALIAQAAQQAASEANPRSSLLRGTSTYRKAMVAVLVERAIRSTVERIGGER
jgi:aerobic carbon-monoxide dehydrogenase medium subunit